MTCKDCVHVGICNSDIWFTEKGVQIQDSEKVEEDCRNFKDKSRFIELPCNVGDKVYRPSKYLGVVQFVIISFVMYQNWSDTRQKYKAMNKAWKKRS